MAAQVTFTFDLITNLSITLENYMAKECGKIISVRRLKFSLQPNHLAAQARIQTDFHRFTLNGETFENWINFSK